MAERVHIEWEAGSTVTGYLSGPARGDVGILLAHGAGAGQSHPFMTGLRRRIADAGYPTLTFDYPYMEAGRKAPDRLSRLIECHAAVLDQFARGVDRVVLAGKSMGGRVGGHLAAEHGGVSSIVFYGYPLVALGKAEPRDVSHLSGSDVPMLFIQGERDRLGPLNLIEPVVAAIPRARLAILADADHSFRVPKRTGLDIEAVHDLLARWTVEFVEEAAT
jgi:hypothetical protein